MVLHGKAMNDAHKMPAHRRWARLVPYAGRRFAQRRLRQSQHTAFRIRRIDHTQQNDSPRRSAGGAKSARISLLKFSLHADIASYNAARHEYN